MHPYLGSGGVGGGGFITHGVVAPIRNNAIRSGDHDDAFSLHRRHISWSHLSPQHTDFLAKDGVT